MRTKYWQQRTLTLFEAVPIHWTKNDTTRVVTCRNDSPKIGCVPISNLRALPERQPVSRLSAVTKFRIVFFTVVSNAFRDTFMFLWRLESRRNEGNFAIEQRYSYSQWRKWWIAIKIDRSCERRRKRKETTGVCAKGGISLKWFRLIWERNESIRN